MRDVPEQRFVAEHDALVRKLAGRVQYELALTASLDDLVAYGFRGLLEARERFDPTRGVKFTTFAYYRVRGAMIDGVRAMAYLPRVAHTKRKAAETLDRVAEAVGDARAASPDERTAVGATLEAIDDILGKTSAAYVIAALGQSADEEEDSPESFVIGLEDRARVAAALEVLPERERALVEGHYFHDHTLEEIGAAMGISKSWASRLHSRALSLLRDALEAGATQSG